MTTSFERILWAIAGAERHILEKCRTDYKRFSAIGATILMTSFIAFCAGTAAACPGAQPRHCRPGPAAG